ncbi:MAG: cupin domain-containing protein [Armatimonadetes bacterium]|nr:cupin domain-containing protein [Armatimonadota bacterium]
MDAQRTQNVPGCVVVGAGATFTGKQALPYTLGISAESAGARGIHLQLVTIAPGARGRAHLHEHHETAIYVLSGEAHTWYGNRLEGHAFVRPGEFMYIAANVPHLPHNVSKTEPCVAVIAGTDPNEQESVVLRPDLETLRPPGD